MSMITPYNIGSSDLTQLFLNFNKAGLINPCLSFSAQKNTGWIQLFRTWLNQSFTLFKLLS